MSLISKKANTAAELATSADNLLKVFKNTVSGLSGELENKLQSNNKKLMLH